MLNVQIPSIQKAFYPDKDRSAIKKKIAEIYAKYKSEIDIVSKCTNVPINLILSFIFIESGGDPNAKSGAGAIGLMQLIPSSANDILIIERQKNRLTEMEKKILTEKLGDRFTQGIMKMPYLGASISFKGVSTSSFVTKEDLYNPLFNILCGSIYLGLLLDEHTEGGTVRLDKVVIRYNKGYFADSKGKNLIGSIANVISSAPTESKAYVLKLVGLNGTLDSMA